MKWTTKDPRQIPGEHHCNSQGQIGELSQGEPQLWQGGLLFRSTQQLHCTWPHQCFQLSPALPSHLTVSVLLLPHICPSEDWHVFILFLPVTSFCPLHSSHMSSFIKVIRFRVGSITPSLTLLLCLFIFSWGFLSARASFPFFFFLFFFLIQAGSAWHSSDQIRSYTVGEERKRHKEIQ